MSKREKMIHTIIKNSPNLVFRKKDLIGWLVATGETESFSKWLAYHDLKNVPFQEISKGIFKLLIDPTDFVSVGKEILKKDESTEKVETAKLVIERLNQATGSRFKATASTASKINARIKEGHTLEDFYKVIEVKSKEWTGTQFEAYLRPETLFSTKFQSYLNQKPNRPTSRVEQMAGYDFTKYVQGE